MPIINLWSRYYIPTYLPITSRYYLILHTSKHEIRLKQLEICHHNNKTKFSLLLDARKNIDTYVPNLCTYPNICL